MTKELKNWYSSDQAKRNFGFICRSLDLNQSLHILGTENEPLITITKFPSNTAYVGRPFFISVTQLVADWHNVTNAIMLYDSKIYLSSYSAKSRPKDGYIQLKAHENNFHGALKYRHTEGKYLL